MDFIVLDTQPVEISNPIPVILGRPFLATSNALINYRNGVMNLSFGNMTLELNVFNLCKQPLDKEDESEEENMIEIAVEDHIQKGRASELSEICLVNSFELSSQSDYDISNICSLFDCSQVRENKGWRPKIEQLGECVKDDQEDPPKLELKPLPKELKYAFLRESQPYPVVISSTLTGEQEGKLIEVLKDHKSAIGWTLKDIKGINPLICTHRIHLEDNAKTSQQPQRRLNPHMKEVVKAEVLKLLDVGIIYPISDSKWVSPT